MGAAPADKIKAVFDATPSVESLNGAWYAQMPKADADATFVAFKELAEAVKAAPKTQVATVAAPSMDGPIGQDPKVIQAAVQAHLDAINDVDGSLVTSLKGHEEVTVAVAKLIASAPPAVIKSVFDTVPQVQSLNGDWFASMPLADAVKSYQAFLETAAAVKR